MEIVLATNNSGKLKEMQQLFAHLPVTLRSQADFDLPSVPETGSTFVENALIKAKHVAAATGHMAIADDSGLVVPMLDGQPGIYSARFAADVVEGDPTDADNNAKLITTLKQHHGFDGPIAAFFYCSMVCLSSAADPTPHIATAAWHGEIVEHPLGEGGFGYDPYFFLADLNKSSAELPAEIKNQLSHRGQASRALLARLDTAFAAS